MNANSVKAKVTVIADKTADSKFYKAVEKGAITASALLTTAGLSAINAFAEEMLPVDHDYVSIRSSINIEEFLSAADPYIKASVAVLCVVAAVKLGLYFLRGSFH